MPRQRFEINLDPWQQEFLDYRGDTLLCTGRRVGKTYIHARKGAVRMIEEPGTRIVVASLTEDQAKLIIVFTLDYLERYHKKEIARKGNLKPTLNKINLKNGSSMLARPVGVTGDAIRGFEGDVLILDEVSRFAALIMIAAKPILLTTGGEIWACSTPFGKKGYFWDSFKDGYIDKDPDCRYRVTYKSSVDVINNRKISESWTERQRERAIILLEKERRDMTKSQFGQEFEGLFMEDLNQFFEDKDIEAVTIGKPELKIDVNYYLGCDVGRINDAFTFENVRRGIHENLIHVQHEQNTGVPIPNNAKRIIELDKHWEYSLIGIDSGEVGGITVCDILRAEFQDDRVREMNNVSRVYERRRRGKEYYEKSKKVLKEEMYNNLKRFMEQRKIVLLDNDDVRASLKSIQVEVDEVTKRIKIWGSDSHITEGLIRACWLAEKEKGLILYAYYS